jgi:hypothetical protein
MIVEDGDRGARPPQFRRRRPCCARNTGVLLVRYMRHMRYMVSPAGERRLAAGAHPLRETPVRFSRKTCKACSAWAAGEWGPPIRRTDLSEEGGSCPPDRIRWGPPDRRPEPAPTADRAVLVAGAHALHETLVCFSRKTCKACSAWAAGGRGPRIRRAVLSEGDDAGPRRGWHGPADVVPLSGARDQGWIPLIAVRPAAGRAAVGARTAPAGRGWAESPHPGRVEVPTASGIWPESTTRRNPPARQKLATRCREVPTTGRGATRRVSRDARQSLPGSSRCSLMPPRAPVSPDPTCGPQNAHRSGSRS